MVGWFMIASAIANAVGAAIGGMLLDLDGLMGFKGWQWVFLATGGPLSACRRGANDPAGRPDKAAGSTNATARLAAL